MKEIDPNYYKPVRVALDCTGEFFEEDLLDEITNISEDMMGYDVLTFTCPECGEVHESYRFT